MEKENAVLVPNDILEEVSAVIFNILPQKFINTYIKELEKFMSLTENRNVNVVTEEVPSSCLF